MNWKKGSRGRHLQWIGSTISEWLSPSGVQGVSLSISRDRIDKLSRTCAAILLEKKVPRDELQRLAGLATGISGIMPQFTAYTAMLWAALNVRKAATLDIEAVQKPVLWLHTVCQDNLRTVTRYCRRAAQHYTLVSFDGSLKGGEATLQTGVKSLDAAASTPIFSLRHDAVARQ